MKKLLALGLSLAMMASLSAVAFAADENGDHWTDPQNDTMIVKTLTTDEGGTEVTGTYTVTIPAKLEFAWGQTDAETGAISIVGQIPDGDSVTVSAKDAEQVTLENDNGYTLTATVNSAAVTADSATILAGVSDEDAVSATINAWTGVPIAEYQGATTFTTVYTEA